MTKRALKALLGSIKKWEANLSWAKNNLGQVLDFNFYPIGAKECPLCHLYLMAERPCSSCPIYKVTRKPCCYGTPYYKILNLVCKPHAPDEPPVLVTKTLITWTKKEVEFLRWISRRVPSISER